MNLLIDELYTDEEKKLIGIPEDIFVEEIITHDRWYISTNVQFGGPTDDICHCNMSADPCIGIEA